MSHRNSIPTIISIKTNLKVTDFVTARYIERHFFCNIVTVDSCEEFASALEDKSISVMLVLCGPSLIDSINPDMMRLVTMCLLALDHRDNVKIPLGIYVDKNLESDQVKRMLQCNMMGMVLSMPEYGYDSCIASMEKVLCPIEYDDDDSCIDSFAKLLYPAITTAELDDNISSNLVTKTLPFILYFRDNYSEITMMEIKSYVESSNIGNSAMCNNWNALTNAVSSTPPDLLMIHYNTIISNSIELHDFIAMTRSMCKLMNKDKITKIAVVIDNQTQYAFIKELQNTGVSGIIPDHVVYGKNETITAITQLLLGSPYWPKHILDKLKVKTTKPVLHGIQLTNREQQVLTLVCNRGLSNKHIASTLKITENTVKVHISNILKSYGVRNRTQLVLAAKQELHA